MPDRRTHRIARLGGAMLNVLDEGPLDAPCVVLAHAILTSAQMWVTQMATLRALGLRIVRLDTRGHGGSIASPLPCSLDELVFDVIAVLDEIGIAKAHWVGLSLGGSVGIHLARMAEDRLLSLVICDGRADGPAALAPLWDERIAVAEHEGVAALALPTLQRWFGDRPVPAIADPDQPDHPGGASDARAFIGELIGQTSLAGFTAAARAIQRFDDTASLGLINVPTTFIVGSEDGVLPALMAGYAEQVKGSVLVRIEGAGHLPTIEAPADFNLALEQHFGRVGVSAR